MRVVCKDGFSISIKASERAYCNPKNNIGPYDSVELGYPNFPEPMISGFAEIIDQPTETVYGWVPVGIVQAVIIKHGGIVDGICPPFSMDAKNSFELADALIEI